MDESILRISLYKKMNATFFSKCTCLFCSGEPHHHQPQQKRDQKTLYWFFSRRSWKPWGWFYRPGFVPRVGWETLQKGSFACRQCLHVPLGLAHTAYLTQDSWLLVWQWHRSDSTHRTWARWLWSIWIGLRVEQTPPYPARNYHLVQRGTSQATTSKKKTLEFAWNWVGLNFYLLGAFFPELANHVPSAWLTCASCFKRAGKAPCLLLWCESCLSGPWMCETRAGGSHSYSKCHLLPKHTALQSAAGAVCSVEGISAQLKHSSEEQGDAGCCWLMV